MRTYISSASIAVILLGLGAGMACAQGSITQDPGRITPGNLTFQDLGPAGPTPVPTPTRRPAAESPGVYGTSGRTGPIVGKGTNSAGFGSGNSSGFGGNAAGAAR